MASAETMTSVAPSGKALPGAVHKAPGRSASQPQGKALPPSGEKPFSMEKQLPGLAPQHLHLGEEGESEKPTEPRPKGKGASPA